MTFLTVITIHKNDLDGLLLTKQSLQELISLEEVEWIVVDGQSNLINKAASQSFEALRALANTFITEPDNGIYDAMNKGTRYANGEFIIFLNAGDELHPNFDIRKLKQLAASSQPDMIWGTCEERHRSGAIIQIKTRSQFWAWYGMPVYHPAQFYRRTALGENPFDMSFKIAADYDLLCRFLANGLKIDYLDSIVSVFHRGGLSDTNFDLTLTEENQVRLKYYPIPKALGAVIKNFRLANSKLAKIVWLRQIWRKWI